MLKADFTHMWALYSATNFFNNLWDLDVLWMTQIYSHPKEIWIKKIAFLWAISPEIVSWIKE